MNRSVSLLRGHMIATFISYTRYLSLSILKCAPCYLLSVVVILSVIQTAVGHRMGTVLRTTGFSFFFFFFFFLFFPGHSLTQNSLEVHSTTYLHPPRHIT
ncbi:hypothetical protein GGR50DRAFT_641758 [Xylaria sp. CBS 124048]|nr:hypothetical protein GGR50DRAFT_641758 [Xylaria sp. CBS 124048]